MWWVKENPDHSRGGFQNRDVGKSNFDNNYGPDYGVDYARYSDPPDVAADLLVKESILEVILKNFNDDIQHLDVIVRNGFVILKGEMSDENKKQMIVQNLRKIQGVREVINQLMVRH